MSNDAFVPIKAFFYLIACLVFLATLVVLAAMGIGAIPKDNAYGVVAAFFISGLIVKYCGNIKPKSPGKVVEDEDANRIKREEYEAFKEEVMMRNSDKQLKKAGLVCPKCGSHDVMHLGSTRKPLSAGKAVAGSLVAGVPGALLGASMGTKGKNEWVCCSCGHRYRAK